MASWTDMGNAHRGTSIAFPETRGDLSASIDQYHTPIRGKFVKIITLTTDFGLRDGYPGVMKGVILRITPDTHIIDISHFVRPQNILEGSLILNRTYPFFPDGTVHILVIDPGVGTSRRPIAAHLGNQYYVCPDNGLLTGPLVEAEKEGQFIEIVHLNQPKYWLREVSHVFHGRDVFAPVAAHIAAGVPLQ